VKGPYYRFANDALVLEFSPTGKVAAWDGHPAITAGRLYAASYQDEAEFAKWYEQLAGWLRRHFRAHRIHSLVTYVGADTWRWHQQGGVLLPMFRPVVTPTWRQVVGLASAGRPSEAPDV
jgi:hypothetical protein